MLDNVRYVTLNIFADSFYAESRFCTIFSENILFSLTYYSKQGWWKALSSKHWFLNLGFSNLEIKKHLTYLYHI